MEYYLRTFQVHYETVRECIQDQKIDLVIEECGCLPWYIFARSLQLNKTELLEEYVDKVRVLNNSSTVSRKRRHPELNKVLDELKERRKVLQGRQKRKCGSS